MKYFPRICSILMLSVPLLAGAAPAGMMDGVTGNVMVTMPGKGPTQVTSGQSFDSGARVVTGPGGAAVLRFADGQTINLKDSSEINVSNYQYDPAKPAEGKSVITFLRGGMRVISGLISKSNPSNFSLRTPTWTAGVRGTVFDVGSTSATSDPNSVSAEAVVVVDGAVVVTIGGVSQEIDAGQAAVVVGGQIFVGTSIADAASKAVAAGKMSPAQATAFALNVPLTTTDTQTAAGAPAATAPVGLTAGGAGGGGGGGTISTVR